jgi:hypothetical protein
MYKYMFLLSFRRIIVIFHSTKLMEPELAVFYDPPLSGPKVADQILKARQAEESIVEPDAVAEAYFHIHMQPRCAWTQELGV